MPTDALLSKLQSQAERELIETVLVPLFGAMGFDRVSLEGGAHESGRDIVCWGRDEFGDTRAVAVQVKRFRPSARASSPESLAITLQQLERALESPLILPDGTSRPPTSAILVTPFALSQAALMALRGRIAELHQRRVSIVDGPKLAELVSRYLPALANFLSSADVAETKSTIPPTRASSPLDAQKPERGLLDFLAALRADIDRRIGPSEPIDPALCFVIMSFSSNPSLQTSMRRPSSRRLSDWDIAAKGSTSSSSTTASPSASSQISASLGWWSLISPKPGPTATMSLVLLTHFAKK